jgi:hypothetical protein
MIAKAVSRLRKIARGRFAVLTEPIGRLTPTTYH